MQDPSQEERLSGHPDAQALEASPALCKTHQLTSRSQLLIQTPESPENSPTSGYAYPTSTEQPGAQGTTALALWIPCSHMDITGFPELWHWGEG